MTRVGRWCRRVAVAGTGALALWLMPAAAWAHGSDLERRRPRLGGGSLLGTCCCLVVVLVVVVVVLLVQRSRRRPPPQ